MPPKEKVESSEQVLQAVILADSFDERFQPITLETARVNSFFPPFFLPISEWHVPAGKLTRKIARN